MSAFLRRIDLTTNILAPILTGQVMTFASMFVGAVVIAVWNIVSMIVEYYFLWRVYKSVPDLAIKNAEGMQATLSHSLSFHPEARLSQHLSSARSASRARRGKLLT